MKIVHVHSPTFNITRVEVMNEGHNKNAITSQYKMICQYLSFQFGPLLESFPWFTRGLQGSQAVVFSPKPLGCGTNVELLTDIRARLGKGALAFQRLSPIWSRHSISNTVKFHLYTSVILSTTLHECETWKSTAQIHNTLDVFQCRITTTNNFTNSK